MKDSMMFIKEVASTVFEKRGDEYFVIKTRAGELVEGGKYSERFVKEYAKVKGDVGIVSATYANYADKERKYLGDVNRKTGIYSENHQQKRDRIVEQAKKDVEEIFKDKRIKRRIKFVINREKRTVVALQHSFMRYPAKVERKGIAKCAPNDCFNVHIGKAIALRRALGLEVPDEYLNAPQPTEVRAGDKLKSKWSGRIYRLGDEIKMSTWKRNSHILKIIDDS